MKELIKVFGISVVLFIVIWLVVLSLIIATARIFDFLNIDAERCVMMRNEAQMNNGYEKI